MRAGAPPENANPVASTSSSNAPPAVLEFDPKATFPSQVHQMISEIDEQASSDKTMKSFKKIISWQRHGMAFKIHDRQKFIDKVMPRYFSRLKYSSWVRQLNLYGFKRIQMDGSDKGALYHENFIRGMPELSATIAKVKKSKQPPRANEVEKEPNFELMVYQRIGMPVNEVFQRSAVEEAKMAAEPELPPSHALASAYMAAGQPLMMPAASNAESSLRDMLMPILGGSGEASVPAPIAAPAAQHPTDNVGAFDPFETLWNSLGEGIGIQSTPHNQERLLPMNPNPPQVATSSTENMWDHHMDVEPLRVFHPEHDHGSQGHESEEEEDSKKPSYARTA